MHKGVGVVLLWMRWLLRIISMWRLHDIIISWIIVTL